MKRYRYLLYSKTQHEMRTEIDRKSNKIFMPGKVLKSGRWMQFTEISNNPSNSFADTVVVAEGYLEDMKFQNLSSIWGAL